MNELVLKTEFLDENTSKLEAVKACHERNAERLIALMEQYVRHEGLKGPTTSPRTFQAYRTGCGQWFKWTEQKGIHLLRATRRNVQLFLIELSATCMPGTCANYLSGIRTLYAALRWAEATEMDPCLKVKAPKDARPKHERREDVPWDDFMHLLSVAAGDTPTHKRNVLLLHMMGSQGLRVSEVAALDLRDATGFVVRVRNGKGGKSRTVDLAPATITAIKEWLAVRQAGRNQLALFVNLPHRHTRHDRVGQRITSSTIRSILKGLLVEAGLPEHYSPHCLRHSFGTRMHRKSGGDLNVVAEAMGHSSIETTTVYAKRDREAMRSVIASLHD